MLKKKKKKPFVTSIIRIHDLDDLDANSIKSGYTLGQIVIRSFEFSSKKQYLLWEKGSWQFMVKVLWAVIYTKSTRIQIQSKNK